MATQRPSSPERVTVPYLIDQKSRGEASSRITALTAYDFTMARLLDAAGIDLILVGDSLAGIVQGISTTLPVTMDEMVYHCRCVSAGVKRALVVGDMPFLSYQVSQEKAIESAGRLLKEGLVGAVKIEGGQKIASTIDAIVNVDIPVMGHVGLTPQSYHRMGGYKLQGRSGRGSGVQEGSAVIEDALAVVEAGAFSLVLEGIPREVAAEITDRVSVPTIGIGAGPDCDGQILVAHDMLGLNTDKVPGFVKQFAGLSADVMHAVEEFCLEVRSGKFPAEEHSVSVPTESRTVRRVK